jgi:penicillin-binding protein 2
MLGIVVLALFAVVFFRLWYLQVLSGEKFLAQANGNRVREIKIEAPRGEIIDRAGKPLVSNRSSWQVRLDARHWGLRLGPKGELVARPEIRALLERLGTSLRQSPSGLRRNMRQSLVRNSTGPVTVATDVSLRAVVEIQEQREEYPGVEIAQTFERAYPYRNLAAHLFGYVREISGEQLKGGSFENASEGDRVGQEGLEFQYDRFLRGRDGVQRIQVNASDEVSGPLRGRAAGVGQRLRLTLDLGVQKVGENALRQAAGNSPSRGGAFVAMNIDSGAIVGMGSFPTFDPGVFSGAVSPATYKRLTDTDAGAPLTNRAIASSYPAASTFKIFTALAGLQSGLITPSTVVNDGGRIKVGEAYRQNAGGVANGPVDLRRAMKVSSDVYFYQLGMDADKKGGDVIQRTATRFGLGKSPRIDIPGATAGLIPTPKWRNRLYEKYKGTKFATELWTLGHTVNLAIGQGDVQVSPLQMAVAYAALGNGGFLVRPQMGAQVEDSNGRTVQRVNLRPRRRIPVNENYRRAILEGLFESANSAGGTSTDVFEGFPIKIAGKTGTAQVPGKKDQSWYVALAPYPNPKYVVATTIEQGGFGAASAAPATRLILAELFNVRQKQKFVRGASSTR